MKIFGAIWYLDKQFMVGRFQAKSIEHVTPQRIVQTALLIVDCDVATLSETHAQLSNGGAVKQPLFVKDRQGILTAPIYTMEQIDNALKLMFQRSQPQMEINNEPKA